MYTTASGSGPTARAKGACAPRLGGELELLRGVTSTVPFASFAVSQEEAPERLLWVESTHSGPMQVRGLCGLHGPLADLFHRKRAPEENRSRDLGISLAVPPFPPPVAAALGLNPCNLSSVLHGKRRPSLAMLAKPD